MSTRTQASRLAARSDIATLDGLTIMRYAHMYKYRTGGGTEQYLRQINHGLLRRHRMTIIQMCLTTDNADDSVYIEPVGLGNIVWVPVRLRQIGSSYIAALPQLLKDVYCQSLRLHKHSLTPFSICSFLRYLLGDYRVHLPHRTTVLSDHLNRLLLDAAVDLLAVHWVAYDTGRLISTSVKAGVPFVLINHFDNTRLSRPMVDKWISAASGVGGVSDQCVPDHLRGRFVNLSDAIDTDFFDPARAVRTSRAAYPVILLPARIDTGKGHQDVIEAARLLVGRKVSFAVVCAGAPHSCDLEKHLRSFAESTHVAAQINFVGEQSLEQLRDWYAACSMVVLPSHSEGLARVLLEAQSMRKPVVAYDCGGMREAICDGRTGFLVQKGDIGALADKICFLLNNAYESSRMGESGREFVLQKFGVDALIRRHEEFYIEALSNNRKQRF